MLLLYSIMFSSFFASSVSKNTVETLDLEKLGKGILTTMEDTRIPFSPGQVEEKELTNKDFFWDME